MQWISFGVLNGTYNILLTLEAKGNVKEVTTFISELSVPYVSCDEPILRVLNGFNKEINIATIHETFVDSDAATLRVQNLINSPVNEVFQNCSM